MFEQTFDVATDIQIEVSGQGDVVIRGWDRPTVHFIARGAPSGVQVEQQEDRLRLTSRDDCTREVPRSARLTITHVSGDLEISGVPRRPAHGGPMRRPSGGLGEPACLCGGLDG